MKVEWKSEEKIWDQIWDGAKREEKVFHRMRIEHDVREKDIIRDVDRLTRGNRWSEKEEQEESGRSRDRVWIEHEMSMRGNEDRVWD